MWIALLAIEKAPQAERAGKASIDGAVQQQVTGRTGGKDLIGLGLLSQLTLDSLEIRRIRVYLPIIFQRDVLFLIVATAHGKGFRAATIDRQCLLTGFDREWNTDDSDPALALFVDHHDRLPLIGRFGMRRAVAQWNNRYTPWNRFIQQAGDEAFSMGAKGKTQGNQ